MIPALCTKLSPTYPSSSLARAAACRASKARRAARSAKASDSFLSKRSSVSRIWPNYNSSPTWISLK